MTDRLRIAVIGAGHFGKYHCKHVAADPRAHLVAVVDTNAETARSMAAQYGCQALQDYAALVGLVDAVCIAAPTPVHFKIASFLIAEGIHVLIEKPMTDDVVTARALAAMVEASPVILQVGHIERFSAGFRALSRLVTKPVYIECNRISSWPRRSSDVDVVFDLMIHDIDIVLGLVASPIIGVDAVGTPLFGPKADIANARLTFASGCVANVTASRVSHKTERSIRVFQANSYIVCDFASSRIVRYSLKGDAVLEGADAIDMEVVEIAAEDSLANELSHFIDCALSGKRPIVDAQAGYEAVHVAGLIGDSIQEHQRRAERPAQVVTAGPGRLTVS